MNRRDFLTMLGAAAAASILPALNVSGPAPIEGRVLWGDWVLSPSMAGRICHTTHSLKCLDRQIESDEETDCDADCRHDTHCAYVGHIDSAGKRVVYPCCEQHRDALLGFSAKQQTVFDMEMEPYEWAMRETVHSNPGDIVEAFALVDAELMAIMGGDA